ncbi:kinase-like domain-containing protein [Boletus reticuloceps]|uniref:Kinase-like domain-containing protein n=1 Tax=Boletus reticuloceps TaxID=495285 RepID=A0A8I2YWM0_9AGAM|nr:kinase-like domain-containing protein [Boletus reticuloceps]
MGDRQRSAGQDLSDAFATVPNISHKIIKSEEQSCEGGAFSDVYKRKSNCGAGSLVEVAVKSFRFLCTMGETENDNYESTDVKAQEMIQRELGIWRRLEHPNIVPFLGVAYGFGRQGHVSLVSLWMANGSLQSFLGKHDDQLSIAHRLQLLLDVANGLCYLHSFVTPIIHGDLSGNNVLLDHNYTARLTDFGYASMTGDLPEALLYLQMTTMKPGALRFAAPEHFLVEEEQTMQPTIQSDIYSFGNLVFLVLSGKRPWSEFKHDNAVIGQILRGMKPQRPSSRPIEDKHWELVDRCWSSVGDRPGAGGVASSLQQFLWSLPPLQPLNGLFGVSSHSIHPVEQYTTMQKENVHPPGLSELILDYQNAMVRDDSANADITHDTQQNTSIKKANSRIFVRDHNLCNFYQDQEIKLQFNRVGTSNAAAAGVDALRTNKG